MVVVHILKSEDKLIGFEISGHADYDEYGKDIVCAGISTLAYTCVNTIDSYNYELDFYDDENVMKLIVKNNSLETDVILHTFEIGILTLTQSYDDFVKLYYKEI